MSVPTTTPGRLVLLSGADASTVGPLARAVGERLGGALVVDGRMLEGMLVGDASTGDPPATGSDLVRRQLLRWSAGLALAETYLLEGVDVVVADRVEGDRLEDYLDLAAPLPVHLVLVGPGLDPSTPGWGLLLTSSPDADDASALSAVADDVVERLEESLVHTAGTA